MQVAKFVVAQNIVNAPLKCTGRYSGCRSEVPVVILHLATSIMNPIVNAPPMSSKESLTLSSCSYIGYTQLSNLCAAEPSPAPCSSTCLMSLTMPVSAISRVAYSKPVPPLHGTRTPKGAPKVAPGLAQSIGRGVCLLQSAAPAALALADPQAERQSCPSAAQRLCA
jgi:hypothetical protein